MRFDILNWCDAGWQPAAAMIEAHFLQTHGAVITVPDVRLAVARSATGAILGAAGIVEAVISILSLQSGFMPGSAQTRTLDPALRSRYLLVNESAAMDRVMTNSFGFGGTNCSLIFGWAA